MPALTWIKTGQPPR